MKKFGLAVLAGLLGAALYSIGAWGVTKFTTDQALITGTPTAVNLGGVSAANGSNRGFATVDHTHSITGTTKIANGGTNSATALSGSSIMVSNGSAVIQGAAGTTNTVLHGNAAGTPAYSAVSLTADVSGITPGANGGTGVSGSPYVSATVAGTTAIPNTLVFTVINFGTVNTDTDSAVTTGAAWKFTVPSGKGGHYEVCAGVVWGTAGTTTLFAMAVFDNGANVRSLAQDTIATTVNKEMEGCAVINIVAAHTIDVRVAQQGAAGNLNAGTGGSFIDIKRLPD